MYHQWFDSKVYEEKEEAFINAIRALGSKPIKYGEQPNYEQKMSALKVLFKDYVQFCENGHKEEIAKQKELKDKIYAEKE